ncbi:hypothetical protein MRS76_03740 [Rhizobiaceae bacterium n13]|uniref:Uncharacterized protein n=1 Tax=Ferirhizobium litorale TaxID=2927786 RepID=A0AAE3QA60_9HYPH|nr:hypothetical protein [Fererhizobium litorale]MDI7861058.1 hypothetical protein [Fererhizobium litorale]MDI7921205.1 hypothetical protein [Fererhizobium litorale]
MRSLVTIAAAALSTIVLAGGSEPPYFPRTPECNNDLILRSVFSRFATYTPNVIGHPIAIVQIGNIGENRLELKSRYWSVERRYCYATVTTSDGRHRYLWYLIEHPFAFAGLGSSVNFCVSGLDPWYVNGADCASLR